MLQAFFEAFGRAMGIILARILMFALIMGVGIIVIVVALVCSMSG